MKKLVVDKVDGYNYYLKDNDSYYNLNIEFYDNIVINPKDIIYMDKKHLLNNQILSFGPLNEEYGKQVQIENSEEIITIESTNGNKIYLKRFYGQ